MNKTMKIYDIGKLIRNLNPVSGCTIGCNYCYARGINNRFKITPDFSVPQLIEKRFKRIATKTPSTYLMTSMSDFSDWKSEWRTTVFDIMSENPQHVYLFLTKRPESIKFETNFDNVWMGVTVTAACDKSRIQSLRENIKAKNFFLTFEPLFSDIGTLDLDSIGWVVIGTETGKRKGKINAEKSWVLNIAKQAKAKNIPVFMKGYLADIVGEENIIQELPKDFRKQIVL